MTRRSLLFTAASSLAASHVFARSSQAYRIATTDWAAAETLLAIGIAPVGIADIKAFRTTFPEFPELDSAVDLGSAWEPNLELLDRLKPDVIYLPSWNRLARAQMESIATVRLCDIHGEGRNSLERARLFARSLVTEFADPVAGDRINALEHRLKALQGSLRSAVPDPVLLLNLRGSDRFVNVYSERSLPGSVAEHLGLRNGWNGTTNGFGFAAIGIEKLIDIPDCSIMILNQGAQTDRSLKRFASNALWNALAAVKEKRVYISRPMSIFGGMPSAANFAQWSFDALRDQA